MLNRATSSVIPSGYSHSVFTKNLLILVEKMDDLTEIDKSGKKTIKTGKDEKYNKTKQDLKELIENANQQSPNLFKEFLSSVAKYYKHDIDLICKVCEMFAESYFNYHPEETVDIQHHLIELVSNLDLLTEKTSPYRKKLLSFGQQTNTPTIAVLPTNTAEIEGQTTANPGTMTGIETCTHGSPRSVAETAELIDHFIRTLRDKNIERHSVACENLIATTNAAEQQRSEAKKAYKTLDKAISNYQSASFLTENKALKKMNAAEDNAERERQIFEKTVAMKEEFRILTDELFQPNDWISSILDFIEILQLNPTDLCNIFRRLQQEAEVIRINVKDQIEISVRLLTAHELFPALANKFILNYRLVATIFNAFLNANTRNFDEPQWIAFLFANLYQYSITNPTIFTEELLYELSEFIINKLKDSAKCDNQHVEAEIALTPSQVKIKLKDFVSRWIQRPDVDCFQRTGEYESFFNRILFTWARESERTKAYMPHDATLTTRNIHDPILQFATPKDIEEKVDVLTYNIMLAILTPLVENKDAFIKQCELIFSGVGLTIEDFNKLHTTFIKNNKLPPRDADALFSYSGALAHWANNSDYDINTINLYELLSLLVTPAEIAIYKTDYLNDGKNKTLVQKNPAEGVSNSIALIETESKDFEILIPVEVFHRDLDLKNQVYLYNLLYQIFSTSKYHNLKSVPYFDELIKNWNALSDPIKKEILNLILNESSKNKFHAQQVNAFCRAIANRENYVDAEINAQDKLTNELLPFLAKYHYLPYYRLLALDIDIKFYESFNNKKNPFAKQSIIHFGDKDSFRKLYQHTISHPYSIQFIELIGIPKHRSDLINEDSLGLILKLQLQINSITQGYNFELEEELYSILSFVLLNSDYKNGDLNNLILILTHIDNIISRFNPNEWAETKEHFLLIKTALRSKDQVSQLVKNIDGMKETFPIVEDTEKWLKLDASQVLNYLEKLKARGRTQAFEDKAIDLANLLKYISSQAVDMQLGLFSALTSGESRKSKIDFINTKTNDNVSWLEYAFSIDAIAICHQMLVLGANECDAFANGLSFIDCFLSKIKNQISLLNRKEWRDVLIYLFTKPNENTQLKLVEWISHQSDRHESSSHDSDEEEKSDAPVVFSIADFFKYINPKYMPDVAIAFINANRLDLLKLLNDVYFEKCEKAIWMDDKDQIVEKFDNAFRKTLKLEKPFEYKSWMSEPGFFSSYSGILSIYSQTNMHKDHVSIAFQSNCEQPFTELMGQNYLDSIIKFEAQTKNWDASGESNRTDIYNLVVNKIREHQSKLSLDDMTRLYNSITSLNIPSLYPIKQVLTEILATEPTNWYDGVAKLHAEFTAFSISQKDPNEVKKKFKTATPSFNNLLNKNSSLSKPDRIEYFFSVYGQVTRQMNAMTGDAKKFPLPENTQWNAVPNSSQKILLEMFKNSRPAEWNENGDREFFTSLSMISRYTLKKNPYHAQLVTVMGVMYAVPTVVKKLLVDMATGQGKTPCIAWSVACAVKTYPQHNHSKLSEIKIVTLTTNLARDNAAENKPFFDALEISSSNDLIEESLVTYTTSEQLLLQKACLDASPAFSDSVIRPDKKNSLIIIDETDVDLSDRRRKYISVSGYEANEIIPILRKVWELIESPNAKIKEYIFASDIYKDLSLFLQDYVSDNIDNFIQKAKTVNNDPSVKALPNYIPKSGALETVEKETGIVAENAIGKFGEPQFRQMKMSGLDTKLTSFEIPSATLYYSDLFNEFPMIIGFSGTLGSAVERDQYRKDGYETVNTARFNAQNLNKLEDVLCDPEEQWNSNLFNAIVARSHNGQPALVFFKSREAATAFYEKHFKDWDGKVNLFLGKETPAQYNRIVNEATEAGTITLATIIGGRGVDFKLFNAAINEKGGLFVIVAAVIDATNVYLQLLGRTARGDNKGTAMSILLRSDLVDALRNNFLNTFDLSHENFQVKMEELRKKVLENKFKSLESDKENNYSHRLTRDFCDTVLPKGATREARLHSYHRYLLCYSMADKRKHHDAVVKYNREFGKAITPPPPTIINLVLILDISSSMSAQLENAKQKLAEIPTAIAKNNPHAVLNVSVVAYSDYKDDPAFNSNSDNPHYWLNSNTKACQVLDFTTVETALAFLSKLSILNGYDMPEALELALYKTNQMKWPSAGMGSRSMRLAFVVTDSLPHGVGKAFELGDNYTVRETNPSKLYWAEESARLKANGVEVHVINCSKSELAAIRECHKALAREDGSVTELRDANILVDRISAKVQNSDKVDDLISNLNDLCISQQISEEALIEQLAHAIDTSPDGSSSSSPSNSAREIAAAKLAAHKRRNG